MWADCVYHENLKSEKDGHCTVESGSLFLIPASNETGAGFYKIYLTILCNVFVFEYNDVSRVYYFRGRRAFQKG